MHPVSAGERMGIAPESADDLDADGQSARSLERGNRDAGKTQQGPAAIEHRAAGFFEPGRSFSRRARGEENVKVGEYVVDQPAALVRNGALAVVGFRRA